MGLGEDGAWPWGAGCAGAGPGIDIDGAAIDGIAAVDVAGAEDGV